MKKAALSVTEAIAKTEVQTKEQVAHSQMLVKLGGELIHSIGVASAKYHEMIMYIRKNQVAPKLVTFELVKMGFKKSRVSEVVRIAHASDEVFSQYETKRIGMKDALQLARSETSGAKPTATEAGRQLLTDGTLSEKEMKDAIAETEAEGAKVKKGKSPAIRKKLAAKYLCQTCKEGQVFAFDGLGLQVRIEKAEVKQPKP